MTNTIEEQEEQEATYKVYIHKNKTNSKVYIGLTKQSTKNRWKNGEGYKEQAYFYSAIKKYGWKGFTHKVLFENLTKEEAADKEKELIKEYNSTNPQYGYNIDTGGFKLTETKKNRIKYGTINRNKPIIIYDEINHKEKLFRNVKDVVAKTGLKEKFVRDCLNKNRSLNGYYIDYFDV